MSLICARVFFPFIIVFLQGPYFLFCATKQSSLKETGDEVCETDAESKTMLVSFVV